MGQLFWCLKNEKLRYKQHPIYATYPITVLYLPNHSLVSVTALSPRTRMIQNEKDAFFAQYAHNTDNAVLEKIWQAKQTRATRLDLGNCGLTELPDALFELTWLEELILSDEWWEYFFEEKKLLSFFQKK
jgi:hypothetical protein